MTLDQLLSWLESLPACVGTVRMRPEQIGHLITSSGKSLSYIKAEVSGFGRVCGFVDRDNHEYFEFRKVQPKGLRHE